MCNSSVFARQCSSIDLVMFQKHPKAKKCDCALWSEHCDWISARNDWTRPFITTWPHTDMNQRLKKVIKLTTKPMKLDGTCMFYISSAVLRVILRALVASTSRPARLWQFANYQGAPEVDFREDHDDFRVGESFCEIEEFNKSMGTWTNQTWNVRRVKSPW